MIFIFEEDKMPSDARNRKYVRRKVTASHEANARSRLPKSHIGRPWKLVGTENPMAELVVDGIRMRIPTTPIPLRGMRGNIIGAATIDIHSGIVDGVIDKNNEDAMEEWEKILRSSMGLSVSIGPIPAIQKMENAE